MRSISKQEEVIMGSSRVNCEITEAKDELSTIRKPQMFQQVRGEQRPPILKKGHNKFLNDNINKLFESVNIRMSKSLDLTDSLRNASKRPVRSPGSQSPGGGFSEPVSLKQALRGLCISQAAEMAAMKRLSMTSASPRVSEAGKGASLYRSVLSPARGGERKMEIPRMMEASTSYSTGTSTQVLMRAHHNSFENFKSNIKSKDRTSSEPCHPKTVSENLSAISSPQNPIVLQIEGTEPSSIRNDAMDASEDDKQLAGIVCSREEKCTVISALPHCNSYDNVSKSDNKLSGLDKVISGPIKDSDTPLKVVSKAGHKVRRKSKLQPVPSSSVVKSNKDMKPTRSNSRTVIRNKNIIVKKSKKVAASTGGNLKTSYKINSGPEQLICQRCKCSLRDMNNDHSGAHPVTSKDQEVTKTMKSTKKGDIISQSSSSICDLSSSTTSLSEEGCVNGPASGNRPHMSKDVRWGAISRVRKQYGFLGLNYFNLLKKLGSGDIGTVYLAELIGTNCLFAIKVMDNEFLATRKKMCRAKTEREILTMLDHPFLPTLYTQFTSNNMSCLVMEFCPGGDLHVLRQMKPGRYFPEQAARFYVAEVLLALEYLHMLGIVYRDLKPENILVREDGHIMLTDFDLSLRCSVNPTLVKSSSLPIEPPRISGPCAGSNCIDPFCSGPSCKVSCFSPRSFPSRKLKPDSAAQARSRLQLVCEPTEARSNSFVGTHEYLAPEIIKGEGHGSAVDWWTLGVLLYELLYGKTPFKGARNEQTLANVVLQSLRFPEYPMVSVQARDLIRGLLVKDPESRLGTETGAAEIKRHRFFEGLNWALIRSSVPPEIPEVYDVRDAEMGSLDKGKGLVNYSGDGEHLELF